MRFFFVLFVVLTSYGSLYPFDFQFNAHTGHSFFAPLLDNNLRSASKRDILGNIILFIPYGVLINLAQNNHPLKLLILWLSGIVLATTLQVLQLYTPVRDPSILDVFSNIVGIIAGFTGVYLLRIFIRQEKELPFKIRVELGLVIIWVLFQLMPFTLVSTFDMVWENSLQVLRLDSFSLLGLLANMSCWLVVAYFLQISFPAKAFLCVWLMLLTLVLKMFLLGSTVSLSSYLAACLALIIWYTLLAQLLCIRTILICLLVFTITAQGILPLDINNDVRVFNWVPFYGFLTGSMLINTLSLLEKIFLYGSLLVLLPEQKNLIYIVAMILLIACIEVMQLFLSQHTPEITDPIFVLILALAYKFLPEHVKESSIR